MYGTQHTLRTENATSRRKQHAKLWAVRLEEAKAARKPLFFEGYVRRFNTIGVYAARLTWLLLPLHQHLLLHQALLKLRRDLRPRRHAEHGGVEHGRSVQVARAA